MAHRTLIVAVSVLAVVTACASRTMVKSSGTKAAIAELWSAPASPRNLLHGVGGPELAPAPDAKYRVIEIKFGGFSDGYTVVGPGKREWSAKLPPEASTEVVASRILWAVGFHQPPIYFLREWQAEGSDLSNPQLPARFREKNPSLHGLKTDGDWSLYDNPFVGTTELNGLLVLHALLGNSDLKDSNNSLYELNRPHEGAARWYVTRDVGHTFGRTGVIFAPRGDIDVFEKTPFILGVSGGLVQLDYKGLHGNLFKAIRVADVRWMCEQLNTLTDEQWQDAFRAGGYEPGLADRFIRSLKKKIAEGLTLPEAASESEPPSRTERGSRGPASERVGEFEVQSPSTEGQTQLPPPTKRVDPPPDTTNTGKAVEEFSAQVKAYAALHAKFEATLPALPKAATPQQIDFNQRELGRLIRQARAKAKQGDIFTPTMQAYVRQQLNKVFTGPEGAARLASVMDENPVGTKVVVNDRYPDKIPLSTMPPEVLQVLPKMPEELEYRFVGDSLVILDPHAHLIVDYVTAVLPKGKKS